MPSERPEPESNREEQKPAPRRGLSPGLLLMAVVAVAISAAAAVKILQQD